MASSLNRVSIFRSERRRPSFIRLTHGFTLVELLVVIAIIGVLVALLLPAIQAAREAARRMQCSNNLKQLSLGFMNHESGLGYLPSSGWGWKWTGDADLGFGKDQPGGWGFNILPYLEQQNLHDVGMGLPFQAKSQAMVLQVGTPIPAFVCPSRRSAIPYPVARNGSLAINLRQCRQGFCDVARSDYQGNSGSMLTFEDAGPKSPQPSRINKYDWPFDTEGGNVIPWNGITHQRSMVKMAQITDGASQTYCVGEKYLNPDHYTNGQDSADDQHILMGLDRDMNGFTGGSMNIRDGIFLPPQQDRAGLSLSFNFGSAHPGTFQIAFCDGSVHGITFSVDPEIHRRLGGRNDELTIDTNSF